MFTVVMGMGGVVYQVDAFGHIEELQMGRVVRQLVYPCLFKADVADAEVGLTLGKVYELLRSWVVSLRAGTPGNHAGDGEPVARNRLGEIAQRLDGDGDDGSVVVRPALLAPLLAREYQDSYEE